jgi:hypothetical protein
MLHKGRSKVRALTDVVQMSISTKLLIKLINFLSCSDYKVLLAMVARRATDISIKRLTSP